MTGYRHVTDDKLVDQILTEGDRLSRGTVDEIIRRGGMVERLGTLVSDPYSWNEPLPAWWAVVHAVYILGAIASDETVLPLLRSLRYAEACENDWVTEDLPSIFGNFGPEAVAGLRKIAEDETTGWYARAIALEGLAAITLKEPAVAEEVFGLARRIFLDVKTERTLRQAVGHVLLDFLRAECRAELLAFGREERLLAERDAGYQPGFIDDDVSREFGHGRTSLERYTRDWLAFYEPEAIEARQKRWEQEQVAQAEKPEHAPAYELCPFASDKKRKKCCLGKAGLA